MLLLIGEGHSLNFKIKHLVKKLNEIRRAAWQICEYANLQKSSLTYNDDQQCEEEDHWFIGQGS